MEDDSGYNSTVHTSDTATCINQTLFSLTTLPSLATVPSLTTDDVIQEQDDFDEYYLICFYGSLQLLLPYEIFLGYVNTTLAVFGMVVNTLCIAILRRSGLGQPSSILLLALVVADSMNMVQNINFAEKLRMLGPGRSKAEYCTWEYDSRTNSLMFFAHQIMFTIGQWGHFVNSNIPVIITVERLLAVYFPVTFKKVVTTRSAVASCALVYVIWLPWVVFQTFFRQMKTARLPDGKYVAYQLSTSLLRSNFSFIYMFIVYVLEALVTWIPASLVCVGCLLIAIKVKISISKRRRLSNLKEKQRWSPRTTRTLLTTCLIFAVSHAVASLISALSPVDWEMPLLTYFTVELSEFVNVLNCSSNFFVYITSNRKLWKIFLDIIRKK